MRMPRPVQQNGNADHEGNPSEQPSQFRAHVRPFTTTQRKNESGKETHPLVPLPVKKGKEITKEKRKPQGQNKLDPERFPFYAGEFVVLAQRLTKFRHNLDLLRWFASAPNKKAERLWRSADLPIFGPAIFARLFRAVAESLQICIRTTTANVSKLIETGIVVNHKLRQDAI